jgi:flagellum-specific ATP synthase
MTSDALLDPAPALWSDFAAHCSARVKQVQPFAAEGRLQRVSGLVLEAQGLSLPVGSQCWIDADDGRQVLAEVVGFAGDRSFLMPAGPMHGLASGAKVTAAYAPLAQPRLNTVTPDRAPAQMPLLQLPLGPGLLGRVVDARGEPLDGAGPLAHVTPQHLQGQPINAMQRAPVRHALDTGVRVINGLLTVGRGQRLGLFAGSGVGKSVLLGMMARHTEADVIVVGLIGERGREVQEFVQDILAAHDRQRTVVVAAPADSSPLLRLQGAAYATAVAEFFRDQGLHVLLLMDSLTRYAMAQREIALAVGEAPATKGYPPSCFAKLPALVERSGNGPPGGGSVTAFYTVLTEGDDLQDPIADAARAILDGHIVLSRSLAEMGHFPAVDVGQSASRVMHNVVDGEHWEAARRFKAMVARYEAGRDLLQIGAYVSGSDPHMDEAIRLREAAHVYLRQGMNEGASLAEARQALGQIVQAMSVNTF